MFQNLGEFRGQSRPSTWFIRIAINESLMIARRNKSRQSVIQLTDTDLEAFEHMSEEHATPAHSTASRPDDELWQAQLREELEMQIDTLPEMYRTVFMLHGVEELSYEEVAALLEIPQATVRVRFMRAKKLLQTQLREPFEQHMDGVHAFDGARRDRIVQGFFERLEQSKPAKSQ